jgi:hypothetical protein
MPKARPGTRRQCPERSEPKGAAQPRGLDGADPRLALTPVLRFVAIITNRAFGGAGVVVRHMQRANSKACIIVGRQRPTPQYDGA